MNDQDCYLYNSYLTIKRAIEATPEHQRVAALDRQLGGTGEYDRDCYQFNSQCIEADIAAGRIAAPTTEAEWVAAYIAEYTANVPADLRIASETDTCTVLECRRSAETTR